MFFVFSGIIEREINQTRYNDANKIQNQFVLFKNFSTSWYMGFYYSYFPVKFEKFFSTAILWNHM